MWSRLMVFATLAMAACQTRAFNPNKGSQINASDKNNTESFFTYDKMYYFKVSTWPSNFLDGGAVAGNNKIRDIDGARVPGSKLEVFAYDPLNEDAIKQHCPEAVAKNENKIFTSKKFTVAVKGNMTAGAPKPGLKFRFEDKKLAGMKVITLNSFVNDLSQMREAVAWNLVKKAELPAVGHAYARLCFNSTYFGLYALIENTNKDFLKARFPNQADGNLYETSFGDIGPATLEYRKTNSGDDSGRAYTKQSKIKGRTYELATNDGADQAEFQTLNDLAIMLKVASGITVNGNFNSKEYFEEVEKVLDGRAVLRWAMINKLMGAWDNYLVTPSNFNLYNMGSAPGVDIMKSPRFTIVPWDYDNTLGVSFDSKDWASMPLLKFDYSSFKTPFISNLLKNETYLKYYLDYTEDFLEKYFNFDYVSGLMDGKNGFINLVHKVSFLEADSPDGPTHTGRKFTNDEVAKFGLGFLSQEEKRKFNQDKTGGFQVKGEHVVDIKTYVFRAHRNAVEEIKKIRTERNLPRTSR